MRKQVTLKLVFETMMLLVILFVLYYVLPQLDFINSQYYQWLPVAASASFIGYLLNILKSISSKPTFFIFEALATLPSAFSIYKLAQIWPVDLSSTSFSNMQSLLRLSIYFVSTVLLLAFFANIINASAYTKPSKNKVADRSHK